MKNKQKSEKKFELFSLRIISGSNVLLFDVILRWYLIGFHLSCVFDRKSKMSNEEYKTSPYRRYQNDPEAGASRPDFYEDDEAGSGTFDIPRTKSASLERLRRWRVSLSQLSFSLFYSSYDFLL